MIYGPDFTEVVCVLWEATYYVCAERLQAILGELTDVLVRHHQLELSAPLRALLDRASLSTVERQLRG